MGRFGARCEGCMSGGDAVLRHNEAKGYTHEQARKIGTQPELEVQGLLKPLGEPCRAGPRPADTLLCSCAGV